MQVTTVISNARDCFIELIHRNSDPGSWIIKRWTKLIWFKKLISADWFNDEKQALAFAQTMMQEHNKHLGSS
jgi:hypothetical protein